MAPRRESTIRIRRSPSSLRARTIRSLVEKVRYDGRERRIAIRFRGDGIGSFAANGTTGKPSYRLIGTDGNVYSIIGRVRRALQEDCQDDRAREFVERAFSSGSYDAVLALCLEYVEVE